MSNPSTKASLHPRNRHRDRYDFAALIESSPELGEFIRPNPQGDSSIDFANPDAVKCLNRALLKQVYGLKHWDLPPGYLCPPIPGRADYIHHLADLLAGGREIPHGSEVAVLDIGVGANAIYPIIGVAEYGWRFVGSEVDPAALRAAQRIVDANDLLADKVELRLQMSPRDCFAGIIRPGETFAATICNPPFHASMAKAVESTQRKLRNLGGPKTRNTVRNFGGRPTELCCEGGELAFVKRLIQQSAAVPKLSRWFTSLVSKGEHLPAIQHALENAKVADLRIIDMAQGQKKSRIVAWSYQ